MANKNEKPINYGNLSRFYQNLKNKDLSGIATEQYVDDAIAEIPQLEAGNNISIEDGVISCTYQYTLPTASNNTLGGVKVGESLEINNGVLSLNHNLMKSIYDLLPEKEHYLTFEADEDNCDIYFCNWTTTSSDFRTVYVSKDLVNWTAKTSSKGTSTSNGTLLATLNKGEKLFVKGNNNDYSPGNGNTFAPRKKCMIYGNLLSIVSERDFDKIDTLTGGFRAMFSGNDNIINHPTKKIIISLKNYNASEYNGFYGMFRSCHSLTKSPIILNIENINAPYCFGEMFQNCTSLSDTEGINISNISSISGSYAFARMFQGCTSLTNIPQNTMPSVTSNYCGYNMFQGCTSLTTASELPATTLDNNCYCNMFNGCTSLTAAPELPATTLVSSCYESMFKGCSNLNYIKCLATDISASQCTLEWLNNVSSTGTFVTPQSTNWTTGISGIPSGWTRVDYVEEPSAE